MREERLVSVAQHKLEARKKRKERRFSSELENKERVAAAVLCMYIYATRCYDSRINSRMYIITPATVVVVVVRCRTEKIKTFEFLSSEVLMRAGTLFFQIVFI
jgi:hypothetical protein